MIPAFVTARPKTFLALAFLASGALCAGAAVALVNSGDATPVASSSATPSFPPTSTGTPTPEPSATPTPEPSATPTPTPTPSVTPSPTPTPSVSVSASPRVTVSRAPATFPYAKPTVDYASLVLRATLNPGAGDTDTSYGLKITATDGDGTISLAGVQWGDGDTEPAEADPTRCKSYPALTGPAPAYQPQQGALSRSFQHAYSTPGSYDVIVRVVSRNADCRPNGPSTETASVALRVEVSAVPSPTPTPSQTPVP